ncbi:hypothetical protein ISF_00996 [Cordyceps fumosorosea ARSEF 2679]|uniref:Uncharacterized protein n=1 Tax=Cordyceps fumosorosea (strain ARSEF 2679) TaxID=1081104 RepID=A0A168EQC1_CORFA|nr:hypothetical protein ISF_00996 [Cordyceps fumosorosea ARSEF 2679]OAA74095.1 hypothetical protein ISF_00996 [Cordyceps fumosorosea ARSEF 2679]
MPEGRESPSPQRQTGAQLHDPPGHGVHSENKTSEQVEEASKSELENLSSNPRGPLEDAVERKFSKGPGNKTS